MQVTSLIQLFLSGQQNYDVALSIMAGLDGKELYQFFIELRLTCIERFKAMLLSNDKIKTAIEKCHWIDINDELNLPSKCGKITIFEHIEIWNAGGVRTHFYGPAMMDLLDESYINVFHQFSYSENITIYKDRFGIRVNTSSYYYADNFIISKYDLLHKKRYTEKHSEQDFYNDFKAEFLTTLPPCTSTLT